jgi:hypothetical protein
MFNKINIKIFILTFLLSSIFSSCIKWDPKSSRELPTNAKERARKNVEEGRGISIGTIVGGKSTTYEFSTSNPLWRASLDVLDFLPLSTVDYSGGLIITDWYNDDYKKNESIKITVQFLTNEVRPDSLKIIVHKKDCSVDKNCKVEILNSTIKEQLAVEIIKKAALLEKQAKDKKK